MRQIALMAGAILFLGSMAPALAAEPPSNAVSVAFKEPVGDRFVAVINLVMGTSTLKKRDATHYTFEIGDRGNQNDYALFFASLPYVSSVRPLPQLSAAERGAPPVTIGLPLNGAQPGSTPAPSNSFGPGVYLSPNLLLGTHLFVTYNAGDPTPDLIDLVYGTHPLEKTESDEWRLALPPHVNPMVAAHIFRLCPYVTQAEPAYGR